jgi:hypothetical protein
MHKKAINDEKHKFGVDVYDSMTPDWKEDEIKMKLNELKENIAENVKELAELEDKVDHLTFGKEEEEKDKVVTPEKADGTVEAA